MDSTATAGDRECVPIETFRKLLVEKDPGCAQRSGMDTTTAAVPQDECRSLSFRVRSGGNSNHNSAMVTNRKNAIVISAGTECARAVAMGQGQHNTGGGVVWRSHSAATHTV
jgi:hypothetical protein